MAISYSAQEGMKVPGFKRRVVNNWIRGVAKGYGREVIELAYQFCDNPHILEINQKFLGHNYYTDIITFDNSQNNDTIIADIVISLDEVGLNSEEYGSGFQNELLRVMIHGVLHICGLNDHTEEESQEMRSAEDKALAAVPEGIWG